MDTFRAVIDSRLARMSKDKKWLAKKMGVSYSKMMNQMRGDTAFKEDDISEIVRILKFTPEDLWESLGGK